MPLLNNPCEIRRLLENLQAKKIAVPCFCTENTYTTEGILFGATKFAESVGLDSIPVYIAVTGNYHGRQQLANYTSLNEYKEGFFAFKGDLERLARSNGPFPKVSVIPSLDHGQPEKDEYLFEQGKGFWGCVMYDCSTNPLEENKKKMAEFFKKHKDDYVIEGCIDEIVESGDSDKMRLTDPRQVELFLKETDVDLIVVNLGTEHRATKSELKYHGELAREISSLVGNKLVLHGSSSLADEDLFKLAGDGICKVNIWTILETHIMRIMTEKLIENVGYILSNEKVEKMINEQWLGPRALEHAQKNSPSLNYLTELYRRNEIKVPEVAALVKKYLESLGCDALNTLKPLLNKDTFSG